MQLLSREEIQFQSENALDRWKDIWHENAAMNGKYAKKIDDIGGKGSGRKAIIFSFGVSLVDNIKGVKANKMHYECDIICIDKSLKTCLEHGITPKYCVLSDAQVSFEDYGNIDPALCKSVILISASTGNYKWAEHWVNNGGSVYFYLNKDTLRTHRIFGEYFKDAPTYVIPAGSNVGNAAYIFTVMVLGYKVVYLAAYNYSFNLTGNYYGTEKNEPRDTNLKLKKKNFYNHFTMVDIAGELVQCSSNMSFSAKWLIGFVAQMSKQGVDTINITGAGILKIVKHAKLRKEAA